MQRATTLLIGRCRGADPVQPRSRSRWLAAAAILFVFGASSHTLPAQVTVTTIGGGPSQANHDPNGYADGDTLLDSQFDHPRGLALHPGGDLFIADFNNGAVRRVTHPGGANSLTSTYVAALHRPVALAFDSMTNLYVLTQGDSRIRTYDRFGNLVANAGHGLSTPTAMSIDSDGNLYVTEQGGALKRITPAGVVTTLATGLSQPQGVAVLNDGSIAVSDTGNHAIRIFHPATQSLTLLTGGNGAGFTDGGPEFARFAQPHQLAAAPNGMLVVADRFNHRVRLVETKGEMNTTTLYGINPAEWGTPYPGWWDGSADFAEAREPAGVVVTPSGNVLVAELFYHILRTVTGMDLVTPIGPDPGDPDDPDDPDPVVIPPPSFAPSSGYFPGGVLITVTSQHPVYYTTDGSEPTTNSLQVAMAGNTGTIHWRDSKRDLTWLRLRAFSGQNSSEAAGGSPVSSNQIGVPRDFRAGIGSTAIIPVVVNLRPADQLRSIQFRVEITPEGGAPAISNQLRPLSVLPADFIEVAPPSQGDANSVFSWSGYFVGETRGLAISAIGTNANMQVENYAVVAQLSVPIPSTASAGQAYSIQVVAPSGTSDGVQASVPLTPMPERRIQVQNVLYLVGDSSPSVWYNAGDFGEGDLTNADVNNAFYASLGIRVPPPSSDVFDAMDVFPLDGPGLVGGDAEIRFLDWQHLLHRSLGLDPGNWQRRWDTGGIRVSQATTLSSAAVGGEQEGFGQAASTDGSSGGGAPGAVWVRHATVSADTLTHVVPGSLRSVPVYVNVAPGLELGGLAFRVAVEGDDGAPLVTEPPQFVPAFGIPQPIQQVVSGDLLCGWSVVPGPSFDPAIQGKRLLGSVRFRVPADAVEGDCYKVRFFHTDGSPDMHTQYDLESIAGCVWVNSAALRPSPVVSDEWRIHFFGSVDHPDADPEADPDKDGVPNWKEFLAGTNPLDETSRLELLPSQWRNTGEQNGLALRWLSAPGKLYVVESRLKLTEGEWRPIASGILGDGEIREHIITDASSGTGFYRVRVQP